MKLYNLAKKHIKKLKLIRYSLLWTLVLILVMMMFQSFSGRKIQHVSVLDLISDFGGATGTSNMAMFVFALTPLFAFIIMKAIDNNEMTIKVIKNKAKVSVWNENVILLLILSLILSAIIIFIGYLFSGIVLGSYENKWTSDAGTFYKMLKDKENFLLYSKHLTTIKVLILLFVTKFLGLYAIGLLVALLKAKYNSNSAILIFVTIFAIIDGYYSRIPLIYQKTVISMENWKRVSSIFVNQTYLLALCILIYFLGRQVYQKKDFIN